MPKLDRLGRERGRRAPRRAAHSARRCINGFFRDDYFGASVKPGDATSVLVQWTLDEGDQRVIYGDLRMETLTPR